MSGDEQACLRENSFVEANDADLIRRILQGETELYYDLVQPHERSVYLAAYSLLQNATDAEDAAQEAILKALVNLQQFRGEAKFRTWLIRIAINEARMRLRRTGRERPLQEDPDEDAEGYNPKELGDWREIPSESLERKEMLESLSQAISELPNSYREVLILRDVRELSIAETAEALDITPGLVKTRLLRARLRLRDALAPLRKNGRLFSRNWFQKGPKLW